MRDKRSPTTSRQSTKVIVKVISKMGISTIQSYCGAQVFEALGLSEDLVDRYFTWTPSRIGGIGLDVIAEEVKLRHKQAFPEGAEHEKSLGEGGQYQWRSDGELHQFNPETIHKLQHACRTNNYQTFKEFSELSKQPVTPALHAPRTDGTKTVRMVPFRSKKLSRSSEIVKRFKTGAMSYGSISKEAHEALAIAMNRIGGKKQYGRGRRRPGTLHCRGQWRLAQQQHQTGRVGTFRSYQ